MSLTRIQITAETDGELHLRDLPIQRGQRVEVIVVTAESNDDVLMSTLQTDPGWAWLRDAAEDVYTEADIR